ncbi:MAG: hypothetical protein IRZ16_07545 [Myxococcaceae bacterium]|nr:hypothetical protein [Myxococcaceae bacterium]
MKAAAWWTMGLVALCLFSGCGEAPVPGTGSVGFDVYVSAAAIDEIGGFQLALVKPGVFSDCTSITETCLKNQLSSTNQLVPVKDDQGNTVPALFVPNALTTSGPVRTQDTTLRDVPAGKDYFLIVEALSRQNPPRLLGASCTQRIEVRTGTNERVQAEPIVFFTDQGGGADGGLGVPCDPRF